MFRTITESSELSASLKPLNNVMKMNGGIAAEKDRIYSRQRGQGFGEWGDYSGSFN